MNKKVLIPVVIVGILLVAGIAFLAIRLDKQKQENREMQELAELDKKEMENEYQQFANQYSEMKTQITNDSIVAQLTAEQEKTQKLLEELRQVKSNDAREITRLKKELATVRAVLRNYVLEIDSLNRLNQNLKDETTRVRSQYDEATRQIAGLNTERASLSEKVAIAAQLDATGIRMTLKNKRGKDTKKLNKGKTMQVSFTVSKNVTAKSGMKTLYVRIIDPNGELLGEDTTKVFAFENSEIGYTMSQAFEYEGEELAGSVYWGFETEAKTGYYNADFFADGNLIGSFPFQIKK